MLPIALSFAILAERGTALDIGSATADARDRRKCLRHRREHTKNVPA
jgi:hypothetical protein